MELDVRKRHDAVDEVARHAGLQAIPAHYEMQLLDFGRKEYDGLSRRVAAANQRDLLSFAKLRFDRGSPIGHPGAFEHREIGDRRTAIARAGSDGHGPCTHAGAVSKLKREQIAAATIAAIKLCYLERNGDLDAEFERL